MFGCFSFWRVWLSPTLICLAGRQRMKTHRTEPCLPPQEGGKCTAQPRDSPRESLLWGREKLSQGGRWQLQLPLKALKSPEQARIWGHSSLWLSGLISTACLTLLFPCISEITLPSLLRSYSHLCFWRVINTWTNAALCLSIKPGNQGSCEFRWSNSTNPSCWGAADEGH